jgi:hypothetical protein
VKMKIWYEISTSGDIWEYRIANGHVYSTYLGNGITSSTVVD